MKNQKLSYTCELITHLIVFSLALSKQQIIVTFVMRLMR